MIIFDPLYGKFELSDIARTLCTLPEVRRLSQVRLLNSITPTLATLSELRRYAHTLGVLHLFSIWKRTNGRRFPVADVDALEVAIILHDVATPPFGHLFEYVLKETLGWDHESAAISTLLKDHGPASTAQPIFAGRTPKVLDYVDRLGVNLEKVKEILSKRHVLSALIFGVVDFDNLDNVWRMSWALGIERTGQSCDAETFASCLDVTSSGALRLTGDGPLLLRTWAALRRAAYNVLVFDQATVASQALLTYAIKQGLSKNIITPQDWLMNDESLLARLSSDELLKDVIERQYLGQLPHAVFSVQLRWGVEPFFDMARENIEEHLRRPIEAAIDAPVLIYAFKERGSFEKEVHFFDERDKSHTFGSTSRSLIVSVFSNVNPTSKNTMAAAKALIDALGYYGIGHDSFVFSINNDGKPNSDTIQLDF